MALKSDNLLKLRALGSQIELSARLIGNSGIWIFTRCPLNNPVIMTEKPVIFIRKGVETNRLFVNIGLITNF